MHSTKSFYGDLARFDPQVALVDEDGRETSYRALRERADDVATELGATRRLVFVELERSPASIAAYLGALRGGHVVHAFARDDEARVRALAAHFRPNAIVRARGDQLEHEWLQRGVHELHPELRLLLATSGTTGSPKLVKLSHANLQSNAEAIGTYLALTPNERAFTTLALSYAYGLSVLHSHLACGASLALSSCSLGEPRFWPLFEARGATSFAGVPHTFEMLRRGGESWAENPRLRHVTQAGGRLAPDLVRYFAELGERSGWRFFVMYGQTEAAPRIAYLPPELAREFPHCIGVPVPGGEIALIDERGQPIAETDVPGELCYRGPNVMLGYAERDGELANDRTPDWLRTGDLASRNAAGLFQVVGRSARFVKLFGLRIQLDDVEARARESEPEALCAGTDERIVIALPGEHVEERVERLRTQLALRYALPESRFHVVFLQELPRLPNGKPDYRALAAFDGSAALDEGTASRARGWRGVARLMLSRRFAGEVWSEARALLGLRSGEWKSVAEMYRTLLGEDPIEDSDSFVSLGGDSLRYVEVALALEQYLGHTPQDWPARTIADLEKLRGHAAAL